MARKRYYKKRKYYNKNRPRSASAELWSFLYRVILLLLVFIGYKVFGLDVFDSIIIAVLGEVAYRIVGFIKGSKKVKNSRL